MSAPAPNSPDNSQRNRLREFQARIAQRIRDAQSAAVAHPKLAVRCGSLNLLLPLASTGEIISVPAVTKVPRTLPWYEGLANVRGSLIGVVDLCRYFGMEATPTDSTSRVILLAPALGVNAGLIATRVLGLRNVEDLRAAEFHADGLPEAATHVALGSWRDGSGGQWTELSLEALAASDGFLQIGAA